MSSRQMIHLALVALIAASWWTDSVGADETPATVTRLSEHIMMYRGPTNVGIVRDGAKALLIDCGEGSVATVLPHLGITAVEEIWFTHHHRDMACGAYRFAAGGSRGRVPAAERVYFENVAAYWEDPKFRWHLYSQHPHHLMLAESVRVDATLADGQTVIWGPAKITVIPTPGHTDGSLSYLVEADGKRIIFCGDAIFDEGQVWELWSLQKKPGPEEWPPDYHGFLGARLELKQSLMRIKTARPDVLAPSHGRMMREPGQAIDLLVRRLNAAYDRYAAIASLRHYFPRMFTEYAGKPGQMAIRPGKPVPGCLQHFGTTWMLVSRDNAAFVMDCGGDEVVKTLQAMLAKREIRSVEGLWVTHYHDDHVNAIPAFQKAFPDCPCITDRSVANVIGNPMAWRLPCISPSQARVDRATKDGESWQWHEFKLTAYHFPGQTLYHAGLFVEGQGLRMLFLGDSFSMGGIDDYCMQNRNWLGQGVGFDRCIALIQQIQPTHIFNCHIDAAFDFTAEECRFMRANLAEREKPFGELVPWDHPNYGMDEPWVRCYPYEQKAKPGEEATLEVVITNHSSMPRAASCRPILPHAWGGKRTDPLWPCETDAKQPIAWPSTEVPAKSEGQIHLSLRIPADAKPGRYVIPIDLRYDRWVLPQFTEAIVTVAAEGTKAIPLSEDCGRIFQVERAPIPAMSQLPSATGKDGWLELSDDLSMFQDPIGEWFIAGDAHPDAQNDHKLAGKPGHGVLINGKNGGTDNLITRKQWGDVEVSLEFMIPRGSNSGVKLHGQYEIQITDSWKTVKPKGDDCGGIYPRAELTPHYHHIDEGIAPRVNAAKAPGEWQTLEIVFHAPRFDKNGRKVSNARFVKVTLNGKLIHDNVEITHPTGHIWREAEHPVGPLFLQADHGPVAFRNLRLRPLVIPR